MIKKFRSKDIDWIDLESPTDDDIKALIKDYKIGPAVAHELLRPTVRSRVEAYDHFHYLVLHFPICQICLGPQGATEMNTQGQEIDFIIGKNFLITTHYSAINPLIDFAKILEIDTTEKISTKTHAGILFLHVLRELYISLEEGLEYINQSLKDVEIEIFAGKHKEMVRVLSTINRDLLDYRWTLKSHGELLASFEIEAKEFFGDRFTHHLNPIVSMYEKVWNMVGNNRETFADLRQINESLLTIQTNETIKLLTIGAFICLPFNAVLWAFAIKARAVPDFGQFNFWIILAIGALASTLTFLFVRWRKWI